ncbi:MAG TPA: SPFH domain-containing protein [Candidatus Acidoferrum sp.]|jgi:membrane protease subunit HflK|nr:SPFH domain-containing protein [Candidatus Acidoferrum sp.]
MERNIQRNGLLNLLVLLAVGVGGFAVARYCNSLAGQVSVVFLALGVLVAAVSWFQIRLEDSERLEKLELEELARAHGGSALFEGKAAEVFPAQRSREQFERFFVPGFTVLLCLVQGGAAWLLWRWLSRSTTVVELKEPTVGMFLFFLFALVLFLLGRFAAAFARLQGQRLLRPGASYLLLNAVLCAAVGGGIVGVQAGFPKTDLYVAHALCVLLAVVAVETLAALVLEMYRPRLKGKVGRPVYDGRLVGLLGQPEGLITTAAQAIDYQFGFKVSETWFYRFFERALLWLVPLQLFLLLLSTGLVIIEPGEQALLERFGSPVAGRALLEPGAHFKWPWPIDKVYRYRTEQIQTFEVGFTPDPEREKEPAVLWTVAHSKEDNFLIANREPSSLEDTNQATNEATGKRTPPVSLLTVSIPVQYQITDLEAWAYRNANAPALLQDLATREVVRYLVGVDLTELMTRGRLEAGQTLAARMQAASDEHNLGTRIIAVGLQDLHPPVKVARDYEKVVGAAQTKFAKILEAEADRIMTNALAGAQALTIVNEAKATSTGIEIAALAQAGLFTNQVRAFAAAPAVYAQRAYLQTFARATANARKYVVLTTNTHDVIVFDLQDSIARDLLTLKVPPPAATPK